jgi:hypothetical protein
MSVDTALTHLDTEVAIQPTSNAIFWFNGRPTVEGKLAIGLHLPCGDAQLDALAEQLGFEAITVIHSDNTKKSYYPLSPCSLIFIAKNLQSSEELRAPQRKGFVHAWGPVLDEKTGQFKRNGKGDLVNYCRVKVRVFVQELVNAGFCEPFQLALRGYITDSLIKTASAVYRLTRAFSEYRKLRQIKEPVYFYSVSLPILPAKEPIPVGEGSMIYPLRPALPARLDDAFIELHETPAELVSLIRESLLEAAVAWSTEESLLIQQGRHPEQLPRESSAPAAVVSVSEVEAESTEVPARVQPEPGGLDEEVEAYEALFEEEPVPPPERAKLARIKAQFQRLLPQFSQSGDWWETILAQVFKGRWPEGTPISDADFTAEEIDQLERFYEQYRMKLARKRTQRGSQLPAHG